MSEVTVLINSNTGNRNVQCFPVAGSSKLGQEKQKVASSCKKAKKKKTKNQNKNTTQILQLNRRPKGNSHALRELYSLTGKKKKICFFLARTQPMKALDIC